MNTHNLVAIDVHVHAEVSCRHPADEFGKEFDEAADKYFKTEHRPTIAETVAYYRERKIGFVMFTVDAEAEMGRRRISNEEIAEAALFLLNGPQFITGAVLPVDGAQRLK